MAKVTFAYDHSRDPMYPRQLAYEIASALGLSSQPAVSVDQQSIEVTHPDVSEDDRSVIATTIGAYVFDAVFYAAGGTLQYRAFKAIDTNIAALALPDPTAANNDYLTHAAVPGGTLTLLQLSTIIRLLSDQIDALTRQNTALVAQGRALTKQNTTLIRIALGQVDSLEGTTTP